jgi:hypothetical protein
MRHGKVHDCRREVAVGWTVIGVIVAVLAYGLLHAR